MDNLRFDNLTRLLGAGISRRRTLTVLGTALTGGTLLATLPDAAAALTKKQRRQCKRSGGAVCSAGIKSSQCCSPSGACVHGACACDPFDNQCPNDIDGQGLCTCTGAVGGSSACCDRNSCCDINTPCTSNDQCPKGSFCSPNCGNTCTNPCIPA